MLKLTVALTALAAVVIGTSGAQAAAGPRPWVCPGHYSPFLTHCMPRFQTNIKNVFTPRSSIKYPGGLGPCLPNALGLCDPPNGHAGGL